MNIFHFIFLIITFFKVVIYCDSHSFCGSNFLPKVDPKELLINSTKRNTEKRKLSEIEYTPIKIIIDNKYLSYQLQNKVINQERYNLIINSLNSSANMLSSLIS